MLVGSADPQRLLVIFSALWVINFDTPPGAKFVLTIYVTRLTGAQKWQKVRTDPLDSATAAAAVSATG
ncbi:MAG: hypothetical protein DME45_05835 [Verrucomicrobia bacterium]|nr:MAG: hypothetical protein DME45_05835 [Verrucomicrobiota bacterium]